jgi:hypothetical protein
VRRGEAGLRRAGFCVEKKKAESRPHDYIVV